MLPGVGNQQLIVLDDVVESIVVLRHERWGAGQPFRILTPGRASDQEGWRERRCDTNDNTVFWWRWLAEIEKSRLELWQRQCRCRGPNCRGCTHNSLRRRVRDTFGGHPPFIRNTFKAFVRNILALAWIR